MVPVVKLRTGRKVGRTIYVQLGDEPADTDPLIGVMDTPELADLVVRCVNYQPGELELFRLTGGFDGA